MRAFLLILSFSFAASIAGCAQTSSDHQSASGGNTSSEAPAFSISDVMTGLDKPWDMAFTPDGTMFFTEKCRGLSVRTPDGKVTRLFGTKGSALVASDLICPGQSGMHGVALDPSFDQNRRIYIYMTSNRPSPGTNRVLHLTLNRDLTSASNRVDIIDDIPFKSRANSAGDAGAHSGGRIRFGPDGFLYVTTGDNHNGTIPQDLKGLGGKVLRVDRDGKAAPGNNTPQGADPRIYTYGHRNVQGITFHPQTGDAYIAEHGPNHSDEVTRLVAGGNGGWDPSPAEDGVQCGDDYYGYGSNRLSG